MNIFLVAGYVTPIIARITLSLIIQPFILSHVGTKYVLQTLPLEF